MQPNLPDRTLAGNRRFVATLHDEATCLDRKAAFKDLISRIAVGFAPRTLLNGLESRNDNFLLLRFIAASMVIYGHAKAITGGTRPELFTHLGWGYYSGDIALDIFFVISGFLITGSYLRRQNLLDFLWARVIRIYPAFLFCLAASAFGLGIIYTTIPWNEYLSRSEVASYVTQNLKLQNLMVWDLPGVFAHNPVRPTINGSIWSLPAEFRMYLWVALLGALGILRRQFLCGSVLLILFAYAIVQPEHLPWVHLTAYLRLSAFFMAGALCYTFRDRVTVGWPYVFALVLIAYVLRNSAIYSYAFGLALCSFVFAFAYCLPWRGFNRFGDYSYGVYLWGFPMQQVVAHHFPRLGPIENALAAFVLALAIATFSWYAIEKPALHLKRVPSAALNWVLSKYHALQTSRPPLPLPPSRE